MPADTVLAASSDSRAAALIWPFHCTHESCSIFFKHVDKFLIFPCICITCVITMRGLESSL